MLKSQQRLRSKKDIVFTEEVSNIALSENDSTKYNQLIL